MRLLEITFLKETTEDNIHFGMNSVSHFIKCVNNIVFIIIHRKAIPTGMIAGAMGQFLASPTDLVKVRLQMEGRRVLDGFKPRCVYKVIEV